MAAHLSPQTAPRPALELVTDDARLAQVCNELGQSPVLAMDTEFVRTRTFFPNLGLIQLAADGVAFLVDPLAVRDLAPLKALLAAPGVVKVFHSCSEDLEVLFRLCGFVPRPVFDTQVAAAFLGFGLQPSLQSLAHNVLGLSLGKDETRSNWLKRPLTDAQLAYAAQDVLCLPALHASLRDSLQSAGRQEWVAEECDACLDPARFTPDPESAFLRLGGLWNYRPRELAALKALCALREREAMARDLPRGFILADQTIQALSRQRPTAMRELQRVEGLAAGEIRRNGKIILAMLQAVEELAEDQLPPRVPRPPHARSINDACAELRKVVEARAQELLLPPELLATKKTLAELLRRAVTGRCEELPASLGGWRAQAIGEDLLALARDHAGRLKGSRG